MIRVPQFATVGFFATLLLLGVAVYKDYGLSWDETTSHINGRISLEYVLDGNPALWTDPERYYGVLYEMPFALLMRLWEMPSQQLFFLRHIATFLFFCAGVYCFYVLCRRRWPSGWYALVGAAILAFSPRMFADAFYNSKDIPALVLFTAATLTLVRWIEKQTVGRMLTHAACSAALIAIRLPGLFIPILTFAAIATQAILHKKERGYTRPAVLLLGCVAVTGALTIAFWPFLWEHTFSHFLEAFRDMSRFARQTEGFVLFHGEFLKASELPWTYIPTWISITTPPVVLLLAVAGFAVIAHALITNLGGTFRHRLQDLVVLAWGIGPVAAVIVLHSIVYDGWRHLYFIYPAIVYVALIGAGALITLLQKLDRERRVIAVTVAAILVAWQMVSVASFMIQSHPYQNVYFNTFAGSMASVRNNFDLDYWGLSFREGLEYIAKTDTGAVIPVYFSGGSVDNTFILPPEEQRRFQVLNAEQISEAKYVLNNYRWQVYDDLPFALEVYTVDVDDTSILSVFRAP